ncbi:hypothetical protein FB451DRAFT_1255403 [Mycena latifolia]|nr:hypothetical protein FB451DRAFT_1255403 [Mycena latifolia]
MPQIHCTPRGTGAQCACGSFGRRCLLAAPGRRGSICSGRLASRRRSSLRPDQDRAWHCLRDCGRCPHSVGGFVGGCPHGERCLAGTHQDRQLRVVTRLAPYSPDCHRRCLGVANAARLCRRLGLCRSGRGLHCCSLHGYTHPHLYWSLAICAIRGPFLRQCASLLACVLGYAIF